MADVRHVRLTAFIFLHSKPSKSSAADLLMGVLSEVDRFSEVHRLTPRGGSGTYETASKIRFGALTKLEGAEQRLLDHRTSNSASDAAQVTIDLHHDALVIQLALEHRDGLRSVHDGYERLRQKLRAGFDGHRLEAARRSVFGVAGLCWAMTETPTDVPSQSGDVGPALGDGARRARLDAGDLWHSSEGMLLFEASGISQDCWFLTAPIDLTGAGPYEQTIDSLSPFAIMALSRHKFVFELQDYMRVAGKLVDAGRQLDRRAARIVAEQAALQDRLNDLRSSESVEFQRILIDCSNAFAELSQHLTEVKELRKTLEINRSNFLIQGPGLLSADGLAKVSGAQRHEDAAEEFLAHRSDDGIFGSEAGRMRWACEQVEGDVAYFEQALSRHRAALDSGTLQLQVAGQRELGEISRMHGIEAAAVVAALVGFVVVELLKLGKEGHAVVNTDPIVAFNVVLLAVTSSFALLRLLSTYGRRKTWIDRGSFALAIGFVAGTLLALLSDAAGAAFAAVIPAAAGIGLLCYRVGEATAAWLRQRRLRRQHRTRGH